MHRPHRTGFLGRALALLSSVAIALLGLLVAGSPAHAEPAPAPEVTWGELDCSTDGLISAEVIPGVSRDDVKLLINGDEVPLGGMTDEGYVYYTKLSGTTWTTHGYVLIELSTLRKDSGDGPWSIALSLNGIMHVAEFSCEPTPTDTPTPTESPTAVPTATPTATPTSTSKPTATSTSTPTSPTKPAPKPTHQVPKKVQTDGGMNITLMGLGLLGLLASGGALIATRSRRED